MNNSINIILFSLVTIVAGKTAYAQNVRWTVELDSAVIFSSPRHADLNHDGFEDKIIGAGSEGQTISNGIVAIDGKTGKKLWKVKTRDQIYTSALLQDIDNDSVMDIFIAGRNVSLFAISGRTGELIWEFWPSENKYWKESGYYNFYTTQWLDDQNKDGFKDLLVANGGDATIKPNDKKRPQGKLMIISAKDGSVINESLIPHQRETYYAPNIHNNYGAKKTAIIFASGGENIDGNLWEAPLKSLKKNKLSKAKVLMSDSVKGFIVNSVLADITGDNKLDIINARINGRLSAIDGMSHKLLWEHYFPGHECYVAPTVGNFTGDETPDIFTMIAVDFNNDGTDEILFLKNTVDMETYATTNQIEILDFKNNTSFTVGAVRNGACFSSTPSIIDIDHDGKKELVLVYSNSFNEDREYGKIECIELDIKDPNPSFPCYLGPLENGVFNKN